MMSESPENLFSRQDAIALTGIDSNDIHYWEKAGLINAVRFGKTRKPVVLYSYENLVKLCIIKELRETGRSLPYVREFLSLCNQFKMIAGDSYLTQELDGKISELQKLNTGS